MLKTAHGLTLTTDKNRSVEFFDRALDQALSYRGDPIATLDLALADDPGFAMGWALRASLLCLATDKALMPEVERSLAAARPHIAAATERERAHLAAAQTWAEGRFAEANARWGRITQDHPRDLAALLCAHVGDFFLGHQNELRDRPLQARRAWASGDAGGGYVLGMAAFGLEETGDFARAEDLGRMAVSLNPFDAWGVHAVAHVFEMQGVQAKGVAWLSERQHQWAPDNGLAYHNWWHLALYHYDLRDFERALDLYDNAIWPKSGNVVMQMVDASALLWRLYLAGADVGQRFASLANAWSGCAEQAHYAFNDVHAVMAFAGAGRMKDIDRTLAAMRAKPVQDNATMTREVGLTMAEAIQAFAQARYGEAAELLHRVRGFAQRFGGSNAQRDVISLTMTEAALRAGRREHASALVAERQAHKPTSPFNIWLGRRLETDGAARKAVA